MVPLIKEIYSIIQAMHSVIKSKNYHMLGTRPQKYGMHREMAGI